MSERAVGYYRVSTELQAERGFSLDAQREMVRRHVHEAKWDLVAEYAEAESGYRSGKLTLEKRPQLQAALKDCRRIKGRLVIAALDRLARNVVFIATLIETRIPFIALDLPNATPFMIHIYAAIAEEESRQKGQIIRAAQAVARSRGVRWDQGRRRASEAAQKRAEVFRPVIDEIRALGITGLYPIAKELNLRKVPTQTTKPWAAWRVQDLLQRLGYYERSVVPWRQQSHVSAERRAERVRPYLDAALALGCKTNKEIAGYLNSQGIKTALGHAWTLDTAFALKRRLRATG